jgi:hypothetical protein
MNFKVLSSGSYWPTLTTEIAGKLRKCRSAVVDLVRVIFRRWWMNVWKTSKGLRRDRPHTASRSWVARSSLSILGHPMIVPILKQSSTRLAASRTPKPQVCSSSMCHRHPAGRSTDCARNLVNLIIGGDVIRE